jgi:hypothetical protein
MFEKVSRSHELYIHSICAVQFFLGGTTSCHTGKKRKLVIYRDAAIGKLSETLRVGRLFRNCASIVSAYRSRQTRHRPECFLLVDEAVVRTRRVRVQSRRTKRASYNGSIEASQASDMGSIPIARSISSEEKQLTLRVTPIQHLTLRLSSDR